MQSSTLTQKAPHQSSPSHANNTGRLKYAEPRDLPSFPSIGLKQDDAAASAAASLGWANKKSPELWKPDGTSASASAAAMLAKDYKVAPSWEPGRSRAGSKAALLAAGSAGRSSSDRQPTYPPSWGNSAANQAFKTQPSQVSTGLTSLDRQKSLRAAKGAMARPRSQSTPMKPNYPDESNAAANALSAATVAHRPSTSIQSVPEQAGAVPFTTMNRQMFTSRPPVKPEVDEQQRADVLHASAVAMAKRMYTHQQKVIDQTKQAESAASAAGAAGRRSRSSSTSDSQPMQFLTLQDAAYKLAQDRLAKLHEEHQQNRDLQEYYGNSSAPQARFSIRNKLRRRSSSDGDVVEDRKRSREIRQQMSLFSNKLTEADQQKRQKDRDALLAAAQRNVTARLQGMDEKVYAETGKVAPSLLSDWELKAHAAAVARSDARKNDNYGKIDVGGGKFMDQTEVDEIAARKVQPVLDDINDKAEKERERQIALKMEQEAKQREIDAQKARDREIKEIHQKLKQEEKEKEKARKEEAKKEERARKEEEKAAKAEQKRQEKDEKRKVKDTTEAQKTEQEESAIGPNLNEESTKGKKPVVPILLDQTVKHEGDQEGEAKPATPTSPNRADFSPISPTSPTSDEPSSPGSKVKNWIKSRFQHRPRAKSSSHHESQAENKKGFIGGIALLHQDGTGSMTSLDHNQSGSSMREVALAGKPRPRSALGAGAAEEAGESSTMAATRADIETPSEVDVETKELAPISPVSSLSSDSDDEDVFADARSSRDSVKGGDFEPPSRIRDPAKARNDSPSRDSRFLENL